MRRELAEVLRRRGWPVEVQFLPPELHRSPGELAKAVESRLEEVRGRYDRVVLVYGRCAPGLDELVQRYGAERIPAEHCYEVMADGNFATLTREEAGTYFLTGFSCQNFSTTIRSLGLDRYPHMKKVYFRNYTRVVYLDTGTDGNLEHQAKEIADYLGLSLMVLKVGVAGLESRLALVLGEAVSGHLPPGVNGESWPAGAIRDLPLQDGFTP